MKDFCCTSLNVRLLLAPLTNTCSMWAAHELKAAVKRLSLCNVVMLGVWTGGTFAAHTSHLNRPWTDSCLKQVSLAASASWFHGNSVLEDALKINNLKWSFTALACDEKKNILQKPEAITHEIKSQLNGDAWTKYFSFITKNDFEHFKVSLPAGRR